MLTFQFVWMIWLIFIVCLCQGNTAVYLLYAHARISGIGRKVQRVLMYLIPYNLILILDSMFSQIFFAYAVWEKCHGISQELQRNLRASQRGRLGIAHLQVSWSHWGLDKRVGTQQVNDFSFIFFISLSWSHTSLLFQCRLTDYLYSLSEKFNSFYMDCKVIGSDAEESRLILVEATAVVMRQCFQILGVTPLYRI